MVFCGLIYDALLKGRYGLNGSLRKGALPSKVVREGDNVCEKQFCCGKRACAGSGTSLGGLIRRVRSLQCRIGRKVGKGKSGIALGT